jgi:hypothetical protein
VGTVVVAIVWVGIITEVGNIAMVGVGVELAAQPESNSCNRITDKIGRVARSFVLPFNISTRLF